MALPSSGNSISLSQVNVELGRSATASINLNDAAVRSLFGRASGAISMSDGFGKSSGFSFTKTITTNTQNYNLLSDMHANGYTNGSAFTANITINSGVYVWSDSSTPAFDTGAITGTGTINLTNNGFIIGKGGNATNSGLNGSSTIPAPGLPGHNAMNIQRNINIANNGAIAGGGGSGCRGNAEGANPGSGGGGAGGGAGVADYLVGGTTGGAGGAPGSVGGNASSSFGIGPSGGGGRIVPGTGGAGWVVSTTARGGGAGGGGGGGDTGKDYYLGGNGGSGGAAGGDVGSGIAGGGGGGWGAAGGSTFRAGVPFGVQGNIGGAGGKCVNLNGYTANFTVVGTRFGAIS
jgi:hypothetical protein